ncbi:hypothetical protein ARMGADRAFT_1028396 [Armillaria gallica]|uniref:Uncharacterized protein n=1 Tax=Armillaria gallica TaxID=47427 RepID=A0A2H3DQQ9_ARMGA|nr:hypothetical protein ARMGADRAFT_1028396 [Armillaria gallica]
MNALDCEKKGFNILKIEDLIPTLGAELSMDYGLHAKAMGNFYRFQKSRDPLGSKGEHATWYESHILFFDRQQDKIEYWDYLKHLELEFCLERISSPTAFDLNYYVRHYDEVKNNALLQVKMKEEMRKEMAEVEAWVHAELKAKEDSRCPLRGFSGGGRPSRPFLPSSGRPGSTPCCIACEGPHPISTHYNGSTTTRPCWAQIQGNDIFTPDGKHICVSFNLRSPRACIHGTEHIHVCSLCGRSDHVALSGVCKSSPA